MKIYTEADVSIEAITDKIVAVIGYGSQGHAHALNLRDSGVEVVVGLREGSSSAPKATEAGFEVLEVSDAVARADVVMLVVPDELAGELYASDIGPFLKDGACLAVAHGFNVHFKKIVAPEGSGVFMVAPKGPGHLVRSEFTKERGVPCLLAVAQDPTGKTESIGLAYAAAIGGMRAAVIGTSFREETETDLFGEQAVLCGGLTEFIRAGYETLVDAGYAPEMAYFECVHEVKLIVDLIYEGGIANMRYSVSNTAEYGDYTRGPRVIDDYVKDRMAEVLDDIQSGRFAREWVLENKANQASFKAMRRRNAEHDLEAVGERLRALMPWIAENRLVDKSKN